MRIVNVNKTSGVVALILADTTLEQFQHLKDSIGKQVMISTIGIDLATNAEIDHGVTNEMPELEEPTSMEGGGQ